MTPLACSRGVLAREELWRSWMFEPLHHERRGPMTAIAGASEATIMPVALGVTRYTLGTRAAEVSSYRG